MNKKMSEQIDQQEFIVTARKWRPLRFSDVVGQEHITHTLQNAIKNNRMHHAYLFCGPRGVGKTTTARILARAVNCLSPNGFEPCNECIACKSVLDSRSLDVIEIDGASNNSVEDIRKLRENAKYPPSAGKYKMYIIDEVHMLSTSAFNALLKTLEEPPPHLLFVFATTESHKVPATIISRCQRFDFRRMELDSIIGQLKYIAEREKITIDEESLVTIAKKADGSMRDSQSIFDQVIAFCGNNVIYSEMASALHLIDEEFFFSISEAVAQKDVAKAFLLAEQVITRGYELQDTLHGLLEHFRNILSVKVLNNTSLIESSQAFLERYTDLNKKFTKADILRIIQLIISAENQIKYAPQPRIRFELALVQMASIDNAMEISELISEIQSLKRMDFNALNSQIKSSMPQASIEKKNELSQIQSEQKNDVVKNIEPQKPLIQKTIKTDYSPDDLKSEWGKCLVSFISEDLANNVFNKAQYKFFPNEVNLEVADSFLFEMLNRKKVSFLTHVDKYFNNKVKVNFIQKNENSGENVSTNDNNQILPKNENRVEPELPQSIDSKRELNSVEAKIVELFKAVEIA